MELDLNWKTVATVALAAIAAMTFLGLIPVGKTKKLKGTWVWKNLGVFVLVGVCIGAAYVPAVKTETPIMFGLITALFAHLGRAAVPKAIRQKIASMLGSMFNGKGKG